MCQAIGVRLEKIFQRFQISDLEDPDLVQEKLVLLYQASQLLVDISLEIGGLSRKLALQCQDKPSQGLD